MRSLFPREHGAYAQLGVPLAAALLVRTPALAGGLLAIAAIAAFLANEPLLVVLGHRALVLLATLALAVALRGMALVCVPIVVPALALVLWPPPPRRIRSIGVALVVAATGALVVALATLRAG